MRRGNKRRWTATNAGTDHCDARCKIVVPISVADLCDAQMQSREIDSNQEKETMNRVDAATGSTPIVVAE